MQRTFFQYWNKKDQDQEQDGTLSIIVMEDLLDLHSSCSVSSLHIPDHLSSLVSAIQDRRDTGWNEQSWLERELLVLNYLDLYSSRVRKWAANITVDPSHNRHNLFFFFQLFSLVGARDLCRLSQLNTKAASFLRPSLWWATGSVIYCFTFHTVKKGIFIQYFMPFGLLQ